MINNVSALALDVGLARIGLATNPIGVRIAQPQGFIANTNEVIQEIADRIEKDHITDLVVGLPRGLQGQDTDQTKYVHDFALKIEQAISIPIHLQDEALTSVKAEEELKSRGAPFEKGDIDALAATYILQDFLDELPEESHAV